MAENLGGIRSAGSAYGKLILQRTFHPQLEYYHVRYNTIRGPTATGWRFVGDRRELTIEIPTNAAGTLKLVGVKAKELPVDGKSLQASGLAGSLSPDTTSTAVVPLLSGKYQFRMPK